MLPLARPRAVRGSSEAACFTSPATDSLRRSSHAVHARPWLRDAEEAVAHHIPRRGLEPRGPASAPVLGCWWVAGEVKQAARQCGMKTPCDLPSPDAWRWTILRSGP